ncbi:MAG TPA: helical backbone metal receptor [Candidatus Nanopelagicales bacterium]|nr:helical backbone metal receptor [Candidatus Nanopelagicales bacterium]
MRRTPSRAARATRAIATAALLGLLVAACGSAATPTPTPTPAPTVAAAFPLTLTDDEGTAVTIPARPERIVSLTPATTEILFAVGAGARVVATTDFDDYPAEAVALPDVASFQGVDVEKIVGLEADLVVAGGNSFNSPDALTKLRSVGIPVLVVYAPDVATVLEDIALVAAAAGEPAAGAAMAARMKAEIGAIGEAIAGAGRVAPRVFYELDATKEIYGPADDSFLAEMIELAGGDPITTGSPTVFAIPLETLLTADPQVIVLGDAAYGMTAEIVAARPGWGGMTAVKDGAIRPVNDVVVTRPGPRLVEGLRALALAIDPAASLPPAPSPSTGG